MLPELCSRIAHSQPFQRVVLGAIVLASILVGVETYPEIVHEHEALFALLDRAVLALFTVEILVRIGSYGRRPWEFFRSGWNIFDFLVTAIFYLPFVGSEAAVLRLARVLRVLRLVTTFPQLQLIVGALLHSIPSMGHIGLLLGLQMYVFAIVGHLLFGEVDPEHFGNLGNAMLTLFQIVTMDDWRNILDAQGDHPLAVPYFIFFILVGTMVVLNLFIGVILNGFEQAKNEIAVVEEEQLAVENVLRQDLLRISGQLAELHEKLDRLESERRRTVG